MENKQYLKKLNEAFKDFVFFEEDHHYEYKRQRVGISVTRLIEDYTNEFDSQAVAEKVAERDGKSVQEVLDEWKEKNEWACEKGTLCHQYTQSLWNGDATYFYVRPKEEWKIISLEKVLSQGASFYEDFRDKLEHLADEFIIGSEEYDIASAIDHIFINKLTGGLVLVDYKTNSDIHKNEKYAKNMKVPLQHLKDTTLNHYAIQLSIYKFIVEKYTDLKFEEMFIVWFSESNDNYEIIEVPYLEKEVKSILESRRVKMNSVPVLIIGKSGSGKSASLRNFKKEEIAIANVLGKPLPFKSDIEAPKVDDYNVLLQAIKKTDKKVIVIDDANYLLTNEFMNKVSIKGYDKYNEMADNMFKLINATKDIEGGKRIYFIFHEDTDEFGNVKPKTIGKLLDDKVNLQGMFTICLRAMYENNSYIFRLKTNGQDCVKTPIGMFDTDEMENDLKLVDEKIKEYYEIN